MKTGLHTGLDWTGLEWAADQQWLNTIENIEYTQTQKLDGVVYVGLDLCHKWHEWILIGASIIWPKPIMNIIEHAQKASLALGLIISAQRVPEPDPLPGISFDTRLDPIQF